jgi:hypothetical protein
MHLNLGRFGRQLAVAAQLAAGVLTFGAFDTTAAQAGTLTITFGGTTKAIPDLGTGTTITELAPAGTTVSGSLSIEVDDAAIASDDGTSAYNFFLSSSGKVSNYTFHIDGGADYGESGSGAIVNLSNFIGLTGVAYQVLGSYTLQLGFLNDSPAGSYLDYAFNHLSSLPTTLAEYQALLGSFNSPYGSFPFGVLLNSASNVGSFFELTEFSSVYTASPTAVTPIPAALPLFASALGGLGFAGWRKRRAQGGGASLAA